MQTGVIAVDLIMMAIFVAGVLSIVLSTRKKGRCTAETWAKVVDFTVHEEHDSEGNRDGTSYQPIIEFVYAGYDQYGQIRNYSMRRSAGYSVSSKRKLKLGGDVKVFYNPSKPEEFYVQGKSKGFGAGIVLMIFSALTAIAVTVATMK